MPRSFAAIYLIAALLVGWVGLAPIHAQPGESDRWEALRQRVEQLSAQGDSRALDDRLLSWPLVRDFYVQRGYQPAWTRAGQPTEQALALMDAVQSAAGEGLRPRSYHAEVMGEVLGPWRTGTAAVPFSAQVAASLELVLTDAYITLADHYRGGRIDPVRIESDWAASRTELDYVSHLNRALENGSVAASLRELLPTQPGYQRLRAALARLRAVRDSGGWPTIEDGPTLKPGMREARVEQLRWRLAVTDTLLEPSPAHPDSFDSGLAEAIWRAQRRHGLVADTLAGRSTIEALNRPVQQRIDQILASMERWRWLPERMGDRHLYVNIANFELDLIDHGRQVWTTRVIVGKHYRRTPVFSSAMTYLVLNPTWTVPPTILKNDVLPAIRKDPGYLKTKGMNLVRSTSGGPQTVDPATVDWPSIKPPLPFAVVQAPGPQNALGVVKFMFPNSFNVYLHDTPSRELFEQQQRTFSSGCIRVEHPMALAAQLLAGTKWTEDALTAAQRKGGTQTVRFPAPMPVHLLYLTAWVNPDGAVQFRDDIYQRDVRLLEALAAMAPLDIGDD